MFHTYMGCVNAIRTKAAMHSLSSLLQRPVLDSSGHIAHDQIGWTHEKADCLLVVEVHMRRPTGAAIGRKDAPDGTRSNVCLTRQSQQEKLDTECRQITQVQVYLQG